jgi:hypothetical protein
VWSSRRQSKVAIVYQRSAKHRRIDRKTMRWCGADFGLYPVSKRVKGMDLSVAGDVEAESKSEAKDLAVHSAGTCLRMSKVQDKSITTYWQICWIWRPWL